MEMFAILTNQVLLFIITLCALMDSTLINPLSKPITTYKFLRWFSIKNLYTAGKRRYSEGYEISFRDANTFHIFLSPSRDDKVSTQSISDAANRKMGGEGKRNVLRKNTRTIKERGVVDFRAVSTLQPSFDFLWESQRRPTDRR